MAEASNKPHVRRTFEKSIHGLSFPLEIERMIDIYPPSWPHLFTASVKRKSFLMNPYIYFFNWLPMCTLDTNLCDSSLVLRWRCKTTEVSYNCTAKCTSALIKGSGGLKDEQSRRADITSVRRRNIIFLNPQHHDLHSSVRSLFLFFFS